MVEVISLLSSSPKSPGLPTRASSGKGLYTSEDIFNFGSDDLASTGDLSYALSTSSKRRKLIGTSNANATHSRLSSRATSLQPAFDIDELPQTASIITKQFKVTKSTETEGSDSITFSSSAPQPSTAKRANTTTIHDLSDDLPDDVFGEVLPLASQQTATCTAQLLSERTAIVLADMRRNMTRGAFCKPNLTKSPTRKSNQFRMIGTTTAGASVIDDIFSSSPPKPAAAKESKPKLSKIERSERAAGRAEVRAGLKASKEAEKEAEKERKRLEKEDKTREKRKADDIAEVNKKKTDKRVSAKEMMLDMSKGLQGISAGNQVEEYMKELDVEVQYFDEKTDLSSTDESASTYPGNIVKWRRKVEAQYNEDEGHWERIARPRIEQEKHVLVHLSAVEFATVAAQPSSSNTPAPIDETAMKANLDKHILHLRSVVKDCKPIYLIEGLDSWLRKNATAKNRAYTAAVRAQDESNSAPSSNQAVRPKKRKKATLPALDLSHFDHELAERLQLHLQLHPLRPLIHITTSATGTATWIKNFTEHISTIPYRRLKLSENLSSASFCMDSGQVKTGENALDTYIRMLQEVQRVTPSMAYGIAGRYGNVRTLVEKFKSDGPLMLEDVKKSANKDGALSDRRLGPQISRRLYKVFTGMDSNSMDGIA